jgi:glycosyltransferase involved in cell wall biosynthesis
VTIEAPVNPQQALRERIAGRFVFGYMGLLTERKRPKLLIEVFAVLLNSLPNRAGAVLLFVGDGEDAAKLKELVEQLQIQHDVIFAGEQAHPHDFYPLFDAFVFPSVGEGFGNVWAEAMHHGLPVICTDVRPMNDYIRHGDNGLLAPPDDRKSLCEEMRRLMESGGLRRELGVRAKKCALENFESSRQLQKLLDLAIQGR